MDRFVCIHGHFYQPPREHAWFEAIELQDSAYPYHDWNERITAECYAPNSASRVLDDDGMIAWVVNNYSWISFNFGPTLLSWLQPHVPQVYRRIIEADQESSERFGGHGSAMAQAYNHLIMPLANERDRRTQVKWGIKDFEWRFRRRPEGMWLPETGVDIPTLEALAEHDIKFTVLAPDQARRVRPLAGGRWRDVTGGRVDTHRPYLCKLPSGRSISLFFYDGPLARAVAFEGLLHSGDVLATRLLNGFDSTPGPQLSHIATDGETYGHHHRHGDMALAYATGRIRESGEARLTVYGEFLALNPPQDEVEIVIESSWSCEHGLQRWRADCGCRAGRNPDWKQGWRAPLRGALDWLRDQVAPLYESEGGGIFDDPWRARDEYIELILERSPQKAREFVERQGAAQPADRVVVRALKLLEMQRQAMLMYTSCGWFFEDISGIETVQVLNYAGRVLQLAAELGSPQLDAEFLARLEQAKSNVPENSDGRNVFVRWVRPSEVGPLDVAAHYAIRSLFEEPGKKASMYAYDIVREESATHAPQAGGRIVVGRARVTSRVTLDSSIADYAALHMGDHNVRAGVRAHRGIQSFKQAAAELSGDFNGGEPAEAIRTLESHFGTSSYTLKSLFRDERRRILEQVLRDDVTDAEGVFASLYDREVDVMRSLASLGAPLPRPFQMTADLFLNARLLREVSGAAGPDPSRVKRLIEDARGLRVTLDLEGLGHHLGRRIADALARIAPTPDDPEVVLAALDLVLLASDARLPVDLWQAQNTFVDLIDGPCQVQLEKAGNGDADARRWIEAFTALGKSLSLRVR